MITESEIVIVGAGPAGAACAWKLTREGKSVLLLDKQPFPRLKLCAGWITPNVFKDLEVIPEDYPHGIRKFRKLNFHCKGFGLPVPTRQYAIRRLEFDNWLVNRSGARFIQHEVKEIKKEDGGFVIDDSFRCRFLVGAGGTGCKVYQTFFKNLNPRAVESRITALEEEFRFEYHDRRCHLWYFDNGLPGYSWYVPKENGFLNIGIGAKLEGLKKRGETIRQHWNYFTDKLQKLDLVNGHAFSPKGYNYFLRQEVQTVQSEQAYIVGDAAGLATVDMGEGIGPAIRSGILAAESILTQKPYLLDSIGRFSFVNILFPWLKSKKI